MTLNVEKIIELGSNFFGKLAAFAIEWIREDAEKGIMQDGKSDLQYSETKLKKYNNKSYKELKANDMRINGKRVAPYKGKRIVSRNTAFVDMTLTGDMFNGLHIKEKSKTGFKVAYSLRDYDKVVNNEEKYGRVVTGLNNKNVQKLADQITNEITKKVKDFAQKSEKITIRMKI